MVRKLKTYQTSLGFYDMAIAAPSMKAALEAWGSKSNLFHQGFAREVDDPKVIAATLSKPGVVLRRPVGSDVPFREQSDLPDDLSGAELKARPKTSKAKPGKKPNRRQPRKVDEAADRKAALAYEKQQKQRDRERRKQEAAQIRERERRDQAVAAAESAMAEAEWAHEREISEIDAARDALEKRQHAEDARWEKQKEKLNRALRRARE